ncbi:MAG: hypothetical protein ACE5IK_03010 [Acidobacteriota bacterium]
MSKQKRPAAGPRDEPAAATLDVVCPCCDAHLRVDGSTGAVLHHAAPRKRPKQSFQQALEEERARRQRGDDAFGEALNSQRDQEALLERRFEEAMKQAARDPDGKVPHPFDNE